MSTQQETVMNQTYIDFAATAFELMALCGLVLSTQQALDLAEKKYLSIGYRQGEIAEARAQTEAQIASWGRAWTTWSLHQLQ